MRRSILPCSFKILAAASCVVTLLAAKQSSAADAVWHGDFGCQPETAADPVGAPGMNPQSSTRAGQRGVWHVTVARSSAPHPGSAAPHWTASIREAGSNAERRLSAASCPELLAAVEISLSLLDGEPDPTSDFGQSAPSTSTDSDSEVPADPRPPAVITPATAVLASPPLAALRDDRTAPPSPPGASSFEPFALSAHAVTQYASGGWLWLGGGAALRTNQGPWSAAVQVNVLATPQRLAAAQGVTLDSQAITGGLAACRTLIGQALALCAGPTLEAIALAARGVHHDLVHWAFVPSLQANLSLRVPADTRIAFRADAGASLRLRAIRLQLSSGDAIANVPQWSAGLQLGAEVRF